MGVAAAREGVPDLISAKAADAGDGAAEPGLREGVDAAGDGEAAGLAAHDTNRQLSNILVQNVSIPLSLHCVHPSLCYSSLLLLSYSSSLLLLPASLCLSTLVSLPLCVHI